MRPLANHIIPFYSRAGELIANVVLTPTRDGKTPFASPLVEIDANDAQEYGETPVQLLESERYEYEVRTENGEDFRLRCSLATRRRSLGPAGKPDSGLIETGSYCGTLLLELTYGESPEDRSAVSSAVLDVRSLKMDFRTEYRGMLRKLSEELAGLVADARSSAKTGFRSNFENRAEAGWLQIQLELLRETLDSAEFSSALQRILSFPHERLSAVADKVATDRPIRWSPAATRQLVSAQPRRYIPHSHSLRNTYNLATIAERVTVPRKVRNVDTPENRFVKFALDEFRAFLAHAESVFEKCPGWGASAALAHRLGTSVDTWLGRGLFREVGNIHFAPLGSPVLQRKAGYREILHWWLRFTTAAELSWEGGEDLFRAGQRDVASLYEYWLFFMLLGWFCQKFRGENRPRIEDLIEGLDANSPTLRLRRGVELGPFVGAFSGRNRQLNARFSYNRRFAVTSERHEDGSWTRRLHPDYTLTFWPMELEETEATRRELLVHLHFDAKYRVENIDGLFGGSNDDDVDEEVSGNYKRQDLLKMHAYRDAIKRSQGAYILYPGRKNSAVIFKGFHEILPGLGAFGVAPDENGVAQGLDTVDAFLEKVLDHLCNRTTAQERLSYHVSEVYPPSVHEQPAPYGGLRLPEFDIHWEEYRALPPAEETVLAAWYNTPAQLLLGQDLDGFVFVRLGRRRGSFHVHPKIAMTRYVLMHTKGPRFAPGLLRIREPGYRVLTRSELRSELEKHPVGANVAKWQSEVSSEDEETIYAVFRTAVDPLYAGLAWDSKRIMDTIKAYESDRRNRPIENVGRLSAYPRLLSLSGLLRARFDT